MTKETIRVMKFGGTSVGDAACIRRAAEIIAAASTDAAVSRRRLGDGRRNQSAH